MRVSEQVFTIDNNAAKVRHLALSHTEEQLILATENNQVRSMLGYTPLFHTPHVGLPPFHPKSTCLSRLNLEPCVVHIWLRHALELLLAH